MPVPLPVPDFFLPVLARVGQEESGTGTGTGMGTGTEKTRYHDL